MGAQWLMAAVLVGWIGMRLLDQPIGAPWVGLGLALYWVLLWRWPASWLVVLPALIPALDLTPWTGRIYFGELDLFVALTIVEGLRRGFLTQVPWQFLSGIGPAAAAIGLCTLLGLALAVPTGATSEMAGYGYYYSPLNALREAKGVFAALLLFLLLRLEIHQRRPAAVLLTAGMLLGLLLAGAIISWERLFLTGPFDFSQAYRTTALFSFMHIGGASVDGYLALTLPFVAVLFASARRRWAWFAAMALFALGIYSFLVTFSRANYLAFFIMATVAWLGYRYSRHAGRSPARNTAKWVIAGSVIAASISVPILTGSFAQSRLSSLPEDLRTRFEHWGQVLQAIDGGVSDWLFGAGVGSFPRAYRDWLWSQGRYPPEIRRQSEGGNHFMRFSRSDPQDQQYLAQRIGHSRLGSAVFSIRMRGHAATPDKLLVEFCDMNILRAQPECQWIGIRLNEAASGEWATYNKPVDLSQLGKGFLGLSRPVQVLLLNRGLNDSIDIDEVRLTAADGQQLIDNGGFESGLDFWMFNSGDHLLWHTKNIFLHVLFETGLVGLTAFVFLLGVVTMRLLDRLAAGDRFALVLAVSLSGFLMLGVFDSLIDDPRIALLFLFLVFFAASPATLDMRREYRAVFPLWRMALGMFVMLVALASLVLVHTSLTRHMAPAQLVRLAIDRADIDWPLLDRIATLLAPAPRFKDHQMDGSIRASHPRILLPGLSAWDGRAQPDLMLERAALHTANGIRGNDYPPCSGGGALGNAVCWVTTGDEGRGLKALGDLSRFQPRAPAESDDSGNAWELAWAYDLLSLHPRMDNDTRGRVEATLVGALRDYLVLLDGDNVSLWHGRASLAASAWIIAAVLSPDMPGHAELIRRAQAHFLDVMRSLALTEGWPEGYSYWINSRALLLTLGAAAYINGLDDAEYAESVRRNLERFGLWTIYMTRPDGRIEAVGDEGPRMDLKDETQRIIDLIAQLTRNPIFTTYSRYIRHLRGVEGYYRGYRWQFRVFNDPTVPPVPGVADGSLDGLGLVLPRAVQFGPGAFNQVVMRTGWGADDTLITLRAGSSFTHHGHYDAGHFTLFKGAPLIITNATYGGNIAAPHRLYYGMRTVSKNSLLVLRPDERIEPSRLVTRNVIDGGQRVIMPTGSAVRSVQDWLDNLDSGRHFEGGEVNQVQVLEEDLAWLRTDLTKAYDSTAFDSQGRGGRVDLVRRDLLYLIDEDRLFVHDRVSATRAEYTKKWLLHLPQRPEIHGLRVLRGAPESGIMQSDADAFSMINGKGRLDVVRLAPSDAVLRLVGGPGHAYYVESDGDDSDLDGDDFAEGANVKPWFDNGQWRVEIQPGSPRRLDDFLVALTPSLTASDPGPVPVRSVQINSGDALAATTGHSLILFPRDRLREPVELLAPGSQVRLIVVDVIRGQVVRIDSGGRSERVEIRESGAISVPLQVSPGERIRISSHYPRDAE